MLAISSPAPLVETLELVRDNRAALKPWQRQGLTLQLLASDPTVAFRNPDGVLLGAGGFYPLDPGPAGEEFSELWFVCRPQIAAHLPSLVRLARLTCRRAGQDGLVRLRAYVRAGHRPGQRLAALTGFRRVAVQGDFEVWERHGG